MRSVLIIYPGDHGGSVLFRASIDPSWYQYKF